MEGVMSEREPGDAAGRAVEVDLPCVRCGYQLRGLPVSGKCPECGGEVRRSLMGDLLMFADAGYVRVLLIGAVLAEAGIVLALGAIFGGLGLLVVVSATDLMPGLRPETAVSWVAGVGGLGFGFLTLAGWVMLSTPDPGRIGVDGGVTGRKVVRWGVFTTAIAWAAGAAVSIAGATMAGGMVWAPSMVRTLMTVAVWAGAAGVIAQLFGASWYMEHMARRVRCEPMRKAARDVRWLTIATVVIGGLAALMAWPMRSPVAAIPFIGAYACFALTAGKYASVVDLGRREIGLALGVIRSGGEMNPERGGR